MDRRARKETISDVSEWMAELDRTDIDSRYSSPEYVLLLMLITEVRLLRNAIK